MMDRISDEFLEYKIAVTKQAGCEAISITSDVLLPILRELKERREADSKPLDIKAQLRLVRDRCPDVWKILTENACTCDYNLPCIDGDCPDDVTKCNICWDKALEGDE